MKTDYDVMEELGVTVTPTYRVTRFRDAGLSVRFYPERPAFTGEPGIVIRYNPAGGLPTRCAYCGLLSQPTVVRCEGCGAPR